MIYRVGAIIKSKKPHACGGNAWVITRTGADIKLKCVKCGRSIFRSVDETAKMTAEYIQGESIDERSE